MKKNNLNFGAIVIDGIAWTIGWVEGAIIGFIYGSFECCECISEDDDIVTEYIQGAANGFRKGEKLGHKT